MITIIVLALIIATTAVFCILTMLDKKAGHFTNAATAIIIIVAIFVMINEPQKRSLKEELLHDLEYNLETNTLLKAKAREILDDRGSENKFLHILPNVLETDDYDLRGRAIRRYVGGYTLSYTTKEYRDPEGETRKVWKIAAMFNRNLDPIPELCPLCGEAIHTCWTDQFSATETWHLIGGNDCEKIRRTADDLGKHSEEERKGQEGNSQ